MHLRLYDFLAPELSKNITYIAEFYKGGNHIYSAVMNGGTPFFPTGFKKNAFSISMNQRNSTERTFSEFMANMGMISFGYQPAVQMVRDTLEKCDTYECAANKLAKDTLVTKAYFIVAGVKDNEGIVISRNR